MKIYCVTHKGINGIEKLGLIPFGVGKNKFPEHYKTEQEGQNISEKNYNYSETSFHYWYWKNILKETDEKKWFGMCQYRRYFIKYEYKDQIDNTTGKQGYFPNIRNFGELENLIQKVPSNKWENYDIILCEPWSVHVSSKMKIIKRGVKSILRDPLIIFMKSRQNIRLHFEMFHGYDNLKKAINELPHKDKRDFIDYIESNTNLSGHCMFYSNNPSLINKFYTDLFDWLFKCEKVFGLDLQGYDTQRIYSFLTERYMPFWFNKYSKVKYWPWIYCDITKF